MSQNTVSANTDVAQTILAQLGGRRFQMMTGAKHFLSIEDGNGLQFKLPSHIAKDGINCVRIVLNLRDTYDVEYSSVRGITYKVKKLSEDLYWDMLATDFTDTTGLYTSL